MKAALLGLPQSGMTTLFNALTALHRTGAHVHLGAIKVPDPRVEALAAMYLMRRAMHAEIVLVDLPGSRVADLSAESQKSLADVSALCLVLRGFDGPDGARPDPVQQLRDFDHELVLFDLGVVERRLDRLRKSHGGRSTGEFHELEAIKQHLAADRPLRVLALSGAERQALAPFGLLSGKPMLVVLNVGEAEVGRPLPPDLEGEERTHGAEGLALCASLEAEIAELDAVERPAFLESLGLTEPLTDRFIHATYHLLDLHTFFTLGQDEVRAWPLHRGDKATQAASLIDPALERGFNRVEVTHYDDIVAAPGKARTHLEGKEYVVRDGDLLSVRVAH